MALKRDGETGTRIYWRASLVPAAAVITTAKAYINKGDGMR